MSKEKPKLGDHKQRKRFAIIPRKVSGQWTWLVWYNAIYEYQEYTEYFEEVVSQGIIFEKYRYGYRLTEGWRVIDRIAVDSAWQAPPHKHAFTIKYMAQRVFVYQCQCGQHATSPLLSNEYTLTDNPPPNWKDNKL